MIVRTTTTFVVLGIANFAVWLAVLIHFHVAMKQNDEIFQAAKRIEKSQTEICERLLEYKSRQPDPRPTTMPVSMTIVDKADKLTKKLAETDRNLGG